MVRRIFQLCAEGKGITPIAKQLNAECAPCPRAQQGRPSGWAPSSVRDVLHRPLYRGEIVWNQTRKRDAWGQTKQQPRPEAEWLRIDRAELRIIDETLCQAADARIARARAVYLRGTKGQLWGRPTGGVESKYLLPGLARCGVCGGGLYVKSRSQGTRRAYFYGCSSFHRRGSTVCPNGRELPMRQTDEAVLSAVLEDFLDPELIEAVVVRALEQVGPVREEASRRRGRLDAALGEVEQEDSPTHPRDRDRWAARWSADRREGPGGSTDSDPRRVARTATRGAARTRRSVGAGDADPPARRRVARPLDPTDRARPPIVDKTCGGTDDVHTTAGRVRHVGVHGDGPVRPIAHRARRCNVGGVPNGIRTRVLALKGPYPGPLDDGDVLSCRLQL